MKKIKSSLTDLAKAAHLPNTTPDNSWNSSSSFWSLGQLQKHPEAPKGSRVANQRQRFITVTYALSREKNQLSIQWIHAGKKNADGWIFSFLDSMLNIPAAFHLLDGGIMDFLSGTDSSNHIDCAFHMQMCV